MPWTSFHWLVVFALGITWILDGLEVTLVGSLSGAIKESTLQLSDSQIGFAASSYLIGAVFGSLFFGWLTDRLGRKKLFTITVLVYLLATIASGFSWNFWSFMLFRAITGAGIGGEYAAVNATIQELIPARRRGFTDLVINGSFWIGAALGACGALVMLNPVVMDKAYGWRVAFVIGGAIGFITLLMRRWIPESPRWLMTHGQPDAAEAVMRGIEQRVETQSGAPLPAAPDHALRLRDDQHSWFLEGILSLFTRYRRRTIVGVALMTAQAFCYNAVFFTYALILTRFYGIPSGEIGLFILPFAAGNFAGAAAAGAAVRHPRAQGHDHRDIRPVRRAAGRHRLAVLAGRAHRGGTDGGLDDHLLLRLRRRQLRLPHRGANASRWRCAPSPSRSSMRSAPPWAAYPARRSSGA